CATAWRARLRAWAVFAMFVTFRGIAKRKRL
ncbi:MAG: hypothetical protein RI905_784, partial [Pseudomonadota bacterium]